MTEKEKDALLSKAENDIQDVLTDLYNDHGLRVTMAEIDTRPLANFRVQLNATINPNLWKEI